jgi:hypothetical protein
VAYVIDVLINQAHLVHDFGKQMNFCHEKWDNFKHAIVVPGTWDSRKVWTLLFIKDNTASGHYNPMPETVQCPIQQYHQAISAGEGKGHGFQHLSFDVQDMDGFQQNVGFEWSI